MSAGLRRAGAHEKRGGICLIEVEHLTKRYGDHLAVDDLSFTIEDGKIYGFLGPNGAGKSTTMNIITGCLAATSGTVKIDGFDVFEEPLEAKKCVGYLPELPPVYPDMTVGDYLDFVAQAKKIPAKSRKEQIARAMEKTGLTDVRARLIKNLSKGYRQRVGLAQAILGDPKLIILDEPTVGLDPKQIIEIRDLIKELGREHTVLLSSHIMQEISAVCDTILILSKGRLAAAGTPESLETRAHSGHTLELTVRGSAQSVRTALEGLENASIESVKALENDGEVQATLSCQRDADVREAVFYRLADAHTPILEMRMQKLSLEDVFLELTQSGDGQADEAAPSDAEKEGA